MLAIGKHDGDYVFFGQDGGKQVKFRCSEDEARSALRQLAAVLGDTIPSRESILDVTRPQIIEGTPSKPGPINLAKPLDLNAVANLIGEDPAVEAMRKDEREMKARSNAEQTGINIVKRTSEEDAQKQEARRARLQNALGVDE